MLHFRLLIAGLLVILSCSSLTAQIQFNVNAPFTPNVNLNQKKREIKDRFKQFRKDSLASLEARMEQIERQIERLEKLNSTDLQVDSSLFEIDSSSVEVDTSDIQLDSLYETLKETDYLKEKLGKELDSIGRLKQMIQWDSLEEQYVAEQMKSYFQSKGYLPPTTSSQDPVGELKSSMKNNLPGMHLNPESFKNKEALSKEAARHLNKLKKKYLKVDDLRYPEKGVEKPKPYSSFADRLIFGGQINLTLSKKPTLDVKPNAGVMLTKRIRLLLDYSAMYFMRPEITFLERNKEKKQRIGTFLDVDITKGFFVRGKAEKTLDVPVKSTKDLDYFLGIGKTLTLYKGLKAQVVFSHSFTPNEQGKRWFLEYGIQQQGISKLFGKKDKE